MYEDRKKFIERTKEYYGKNLAERWSRFLINKSSVIDIYNYLKDKNIKVHLIEIGDYKKFQTIITSLDRIERDHTIIWNISDGCNIYKGSYVPSLAKLLNFKFYGSETYTQYIAQDKFKFTAICEKIGVYIPKTYLYEYDEEKDIESYYPDQIKLNKSKTFFIKPSEFDNNIGITLQSKVTGIELHDSIRQLWKQIHHKILIQEYIDGFDIRVCYVGKNPIEKSKIGILKVEKIDIINNKKVEFITEEQYNNIKEKISLLENQELKENILDSIMKIVHTLNIRSYFAFDIRVDKKTFQPYFLELNTAPFILNDLMKSYSHFIYNKDIKEVFYESILNSLSS